MRRLPICALAHALTLSCLLPAAAVAAQSRGAASPTAVAQAQRQLDALDVNACVTAELPIERAGPRPDGREGAICGWGQRRQDRMQLPEPRACRAGLTCCAAGGAAGSDSVCMRVQAGSCPPFP